MSETKQAEVEGSKELVQASNVGNLAGKGIGTETAMSNLLDAIVNDLVEDKADYEKTRYLLSAAGKKLALENIKIRAGFYKRDKGSGGNAGGGFLGA